jgi:hypothetical protein
LLRATDGGTHHSTKAVRLVGRTTKEQNKKSNPRA